ncbi:MAG: hypothetical protein KAR33_11635, partial [Candidatus Thorarchaeota archaeon]|nr:hypothetical protein [Candidatus Thorarchaeota archaeon]
DLANVTFYWGDIASGIPVDCQLGINATITVVSVTQPGLDVSNVTILNIVQSADVGAYASFFLLLNTTYLDSYGTYEFRITIDWTNPSLAPYYEDQNNKLMTVVVRMRNTAVPQILVDSVSYGENATVRLQYVDLDNSSQLVTGVSLNITVLDGLTYQVNPIPVGGFYEVYVVTESAGLLGTVRINMTIEWYGTPYYENQTSVVAFLTINMKVATMEITYPDVTPYLDNVTFFIHLRDSLTLEYINNNDSYISGVFVIPSIGSTPIISYVVASDGTYLVTINSTLLGQLGTYVITITFDHSGSSPYYSVLTRNVTGVVRARATSLDYEPVSAQPYGNYSIFTVTYLDVDAASTPIDTGDVYLSCGSSDQTLAAGVNYWISYQGSGVYQINISTVALGAPNTYVITVEANSTADWWLASSSRNINFRVSYRTVELSTTSPDSTYYDEVTFFTVTLIDIDTGGAGTGLTGMTANLALAFTTPSGLPTGSVSIVEIGNGQYNVSFDTSILNELTDYTIEVTFNAPNYWADAGPRAVTGRVSARPTQLSYDVSGATPYLDNVTITITFEDSLSFSGVAGGTILLSCATAATSLSLGANYWITDAGAGVYTAYIDSTALGNVSTFSISAQMTFEGEPFYQNRTTSIPIEVRERATRLTYTPPPETPFSNDLVVALNYYDVDAGLIAIPNNESYFSLDEINGTAVDASYYWVEYVSGAAYRMHINTTKLDIFGRYVLTISVTGNPAGRYANQTISVDADVRARSTQLSTAPISQASYTENATVTFYYTDIDADTGVYNETLSGGVHITLNTSVGWWVVQDSPGTYRLLINATELGATGEFAFLASFSWINGKPFYANRTLEFVVSITGAGSVLTYSPPEHVPIGDDIVIILEFKDSSTGAGISNASGYVYTSITPLNSTPGGPFQYTLTNGTPGVYIFTINSTPFWISGALFFDIDFVWIGGLPNYNDVNGTVVRAVIREIFTQTLADSPNPGTVPIGDNSTVVITFYDLDHDGNV